MDNTILERSSVEHKRAMDLPTGSLGWLVTRNCIWSGAGILDQHRFDICQWCPEGSDLSDDICLCEILFQEIIFEPSHHLSLPLLFLL